jgi:NADH:ubiquinone oxidoreductase subunit E
VIGEWAFLTAGGSSLAIGPDFKVLYVVEQLPEKDRPRVFAMVSNFDNKRARFDSDGLRRLLATRASRPERVPVIFEELKAIERQHGYLPQEELVALSRRLQVPLYKLHGVASFYPHFHLTPPARAEVRVCADMSCHLHGACDLKAGMERIFRGLGEKEQPPDFHRRVRRKQQGRYGLARPLDQIRR